MNYLKVLRNQAPFVFCFNTIIAKISGVIKHNMLLICLISFEFEITPLVRPFFFLKRTKKDSVTSFMQMTGGGDWLDNCGKEAYIFSL